MNSEHYRTKIDALELELILCFKLANTLNKNCAIKQANTLNKNFAIG